ncbi:MAG: hypothetical protein HQK76_18115 [Desulfobacterales bacterium]|nr:hypothetical protein [Desulfobacterales bacterium]
MENFYEMFSKQHESAKLEIERLKKEMDLARQIESFFSKLTQFLKKDWFIHIFDVLKKMQN